MASLSKLRNTAPSLQEISVCDDYTLEERKLIQGFHDEAKRRNEAENVTHWNVRGTPKNELKVVKVTNPN